jgi:hypothetical protein
MNVAAFLLSTVNTCVCTGRAATLVTAVRNEEDGAAHCRGAVRMRGRAQRARRDKHTHLCAVHEAEVRVGVHLNACGGRQDAVVAHVDGQLLCGPGSRQAPKLEPRPPRGVQRGGLLLHTAHAGLPDGRQLAARLANAGLRFP